MKDYYSLAIKILEFDLADQAIEHLVIDDIKRRLVGKYRMPKELVDNWIKERLPLRCEICGHHTKTYELVIDHCHRTNRVRGLLCNRCNQGLGNFRDKPMLMINAITYLTEEKSGDKNLLVSQPEDFY